MARPDDVGLLASLRSDGTGLLTATALGLLAAGLFAWFLAMTDQLLPHDLAWLTIPERELRSIADGRLVHFMGHDRAAFGGTLIAIGVLYLWLIRFPLAEGRAWAWWLLAVGGTFGFLTFLSYLGTGYLDSWHGLATLVLLPLFALGLARSRPRPSADSGIRSVLTPGERPSTWSRAWLGRSLLLLTAVGMLVAGLVIVTIGTFVVFVPQDLEFIGLDRAALDGIDPRLVPLIAHDRAGFGGGLAVGRADRARLRVVRPVEPGTLGGAADRRRGGFRRCRRRSRADRLSRREPRRAGDPRRRTVRRGDRAQSTSRRSTTLNRCSTTRVSSSIA